MGIISSMKRQKAVYWATPTPDGTGGYTYDHPVQVKCRWQDTSERFLDPEGAEVVSRSKVFPDQVCEVGGYLWLGKLTDLTEAQMGNPDGLEGAYRIRAFKSIPNLLTTETLYIAML